MPECQICKHDFKKLKFSTEHIKICTRCVNSLNESPEPASSAQARFAEMLKRGMERNAQRDLQSDDAWKQLKARKTLKDLDAAVADRLHDWITSLLKKAENSTRDFKIMRAHRRGLLRMDGFTDYPGGWRDVARSIRIRDGMCCTACGTSDRLLDVHHIVYLSKHGTNQQHNLITLCRTCHESEHGRILDPLEKHDPETKQQPAHTDAKNTNPEYGSRTLGTPTTPPTISISSSVDLTCPKCEAALNAKLTTATLAAQKVRCPICTLVFCADDGFSARLKTRPVTTGPKPHVTTKAPEPVADRATVNMEQPPKTPPIKDAATAPHVSAQQNQVQASAHSPKPSASTASAPTKGAGFPWAKAFQIFAFLIGWNAATKSQHPIGAFLSNWALWAAIFWFVGHLINSNGKSSSSGEGPGSGNSSG